MATEEKKIEKIKTEFKIVRYSDRPKRELTVKERNIATREISASANRTMGKWLNE